MGSKSRSSRIALITGSSRDLGRNMAVRRPAALRLDGGHIASLDGFVGQVKKTLTDRGHGNGVDILVNNAGIGASLPFEKATDADSDRFMNIH